jgi:hypothetical protein
MKNPIVSCCVSLLISGHSPGQKITFSDIQTSYDGMPAKPRVFLNGVMREATFTYREIKTSEAPVVFSNRIPDELPLSYTSLGFAANQTSALGNLVELAGTQRVADHAEVIMVTWATAAKYPEWAELDPSGYRHPVTASIYQLQTDVNGVTTVRTVEEASAHIQIPWRPATLPDGSPYPYNGYAFKALIPLSASITIPDSCIISIGFNTQNSGAAPLGVAGPYNELNLALSSLAATTGRDPEPNAVFWVYKGKWYYPASNWGGFGSPILRLSARATPLPAPTLDATPEPVNAGVYHARAVIQPENVEADTVLSISKASVIFETAGLTKSIADPDPFITVVNSSPGLVTSITYNNSPSVPVRPDKYSFAIHATDRNHSGSLTGEFHLTGITYQQWRQQTDLDDGTPEGSAWLAYATGSELRRVTQPVALEAGPNGITARFSQRREMKGVRLALEFSPDLARWTTVQSARTPIDDFWETLATTSATPGGFFRLRAEAE